MWNTASSEALLLSLRVSFIATLLIAAVGTPVAFILVRHRNVYTRILESLLSLPLVIPPVVTGYLLLIVLSPAGFLGEWLELFGLRFSLNWKGAVITSGALAFPLYLAVAKVAFEKCDKRLEDAAKTLNAGPLKILFTITLPPALFGLVGAGSLAFARAFGEFGATMMLAGNIPGQTRTAPQAIYSHLIAGRYDETWGLVIVSIVIGFSAMIISQLLIKPSYSISKKS